MYPISLGRRLLPGRRLSAKYIPSRPALSFQLAPPLHRCQGTQPVSLNISLASFRRAIHSLGTTLLIDEEAANWDSSARLAFRRGTGTTKAKTSAQQNA